MQLREIAHVRSGDKGNISQISVIAKEDIHFPSLLQWMTADRLAEHFPGLNCNSIVRFELPSICALNFVLEGALPGGVTRSLAFDAHGKTLAMQLLTLQIPEE